MMRTTRAAKVAASANARETSSGICFGHRIYRDHSAYQVGQESASRQSRDLSGELHKIRSNRIDEHEGSLAVTNL